MGSIFNRKAIVGAFKSFTTKVLQTPLDVLNTEVKDTRRRVDTLFRLSPATWQVRAKVRTTAEGASEWNIPELLLYKDGADTKCKNTFNAEYDSDALVELMRISNFAPVNKPWNEDTWDYSIVPANFNTAFCFIPAFTAGIITGGVYILPKSEEGYAIFGDKVAEDTVITVIETEDDPAAHASADDSNKIETLGKVWYSAWDLFIKTDATPLEVYTALIGSTNFSTYFDVYYAGEGAFVFGYDGVPYMFMRHPVTLTLQESVVTALYEKLSYLFDETFDPAADPKSRAVCIVVPQQMYSDADDTNYSRYYEHDGEFEITVEDLKYDYELTTQELASSYVVPFAVRTDKSTVVFCDGTRIYSTRQPENRFGPSAEDQYRKYMLTGTSFSRFSLESIRYDIAIDDYGEIWPWSDTEIGWYDATTRLHDTVDTVEVRRLWEVDKEHFEFRKHQPTAEGDAYLPLFTVDRSKGYVGVGTGLDPADIPVLLFSPPRDLQGGTIAVDPEWKDSMLALCAPSDAEEITRAGLLFHRVGHVSGIAADDKNCSYMFQHYGRDNSTAAPGSSANDGFYLGTRSRLLFIGAGSETYAGSESIVSSHGFRNHIALKGGDSRAAVPVDVGSANSDLRTIALKWAAMHPGTDYADGEDKPGIREYTQVSDTWRSDDRYSARKWEAFYINKLFLEDGSGSGALNESRPSMHFTMWGRENASEDAFIKLMRKYGSGNNITDDYPGKDMPGEVGLRVGRRYLTAAQETRTLKSKVVELTATTEAGLTGYIPKIMSYIGPANTPGVFCGLTTVDSMEHTDSGLSVIPGTVSLTRGATNNINLTSSGSQILKEDAYISVQSGGIALRYSTRSNVTVMEDKIYMKHEAAGAGDSREAKITTSQDTAKLEYTDIVGNHSVMGIDNIGPYMNGAVNVTMLAAAVIDMNAGTNIDIDALTKIDIDAPELNITANRIGAGVFTGLLKLAANGLIAGKGLRLTGKYWGGTTANIYVDVTSTGAGLDLTLQLKQVTIGADVFWAFQEV